MLAKDPIYLKELGDELIGQLDTCRLCPQECQANRTAGEKGECGADSTLKVASINLHFGEEPPLSGHRGSGTIFLSGCSLECLYCQNYPISQQMVGSEMSIEELSEGMLRLARKGAHNINFVTPDHYFGHIVTALAKAVKQGLEIPMVCNCSGWQRLEILKKLKGVFDVYLVDMRYSDSKIARTCSNASRYKEINQAAVKEMFNQVGNLVINSDGTASRGVIVRHLVLPHNLSGSEDVFQYLAREVSDDVYVSLMCQYFPAYKAIGHAQLGRQITPSEFDNAVEMFYNAGLKNGYIQRMGPGGA